MSAELLRAYRAAISLSQREFAALMDIPLRTYENLESGVNEVRGVHLAAARWAIVERARRAPLILLDGPAKEAAQAIKEAAGHL